MMTQRYAIGIDLGTTNCVLSYAPLDVDEPKIELLPIPQITAPATIESRDSLPSFLYLAPPHEADSGALALPWKEKNAAAVGEMARQQAAEAPERTVGAAKSWLCYAKVDRHQPILPWNAPADVDKVSPVTASQRYMEHLIAAWRDAFPDAPITEQFVVLTVPASFDAAARELTREAALNAGLPASLVLLEEPQAAVYAWLAAQGDRWRKELKVGDRLLVCDVGGGTTDLSLVRATEEAGELALEREAVGKHLLVGGDNMDLALAHHVSLLFGKKNVSLDPWQSVSLWHSCRLAKEKLLAGEAESYPISVLGRGSKLIGGTVSVEVERDDVSQLLIEGFFPVCGFDNQPEKRRASGFQEIGLPFETDTAITKHLAAFLQAQMGDSDESLPSHILFNGGVFRAGALRDRLLETLGTWSANEQPPETLAGNEDLDHAVARGAAYYAWAKQHGGVRIRGGIPRSYYVGIETSGLAIPGAPRPLNALCVAQAGMEEGTEADVPSQETGAVPLLQFQYAKGRSARRVTVPLERRRVGRNRFDGNGTHGGRSGRRALCPGAVPLESDRTGYAGTVVFQSPDWRRVEAGIQRAGGIEAASPPQRIACAVTSGRVAATGTTRVQTAIYA